LLEDDPLWEVCPADAPAEPGESDQLSVHPPDPRVKVLVIETPRYAFLFVNAEDNEGNSFIPLIDEAS
jgi:hypothetical protein